LIAPPPPSSSPPFPGRFVVDDVLTLDALTYAVVPS
jgi:hypothetical protein